MDVRTLVAGIATDPPADPLMEAALRLAERTGADLHLVHACAPGEPEGRRGAAEAAMEERAAELAPAARAFAVARPGRAEEVLAAVAREAGADLLLLSPTRRGAVAGRLLGTTAQQVIRGATAPVAVLRGAVPPGGRVLLTTDLSAHSHAAHPRGAALAAALVGGDGPLRTLYVAPPVFADEGLGDAAADEAQGRAELDAFLAAVPAGTPATEPRVRLGEPAREILREAAEWGAALVVVGTHARTGAARWLLGSVAEDVLRGARCSVVVVPPSPER